MEPRSISLARALSKLGACSFKQAIRAIRTGRVTVAGERADDPRRAVVLESTAIALDGRPLEHRQRLVVAFNKPSGVVTTRADPAGRVTVYDVLGDVGAWVAPVGRLDRDTSGLLIFTNDTQLGARLTDPAHHVAKTYHARIRGLMLAEAISFLSAGITLRNGVSLRPARVRTLGARRDGTSWIEIIVTEGRKRQVRRMCSAVGHPVLELIRVRIGDLVLADLGVGEWRPLTPQEVQRLEALGGHPKPAIDGQLKTGHHG